MQSLEDGRFHMRNSVSSPSALGRSTSSWRQSWPHHTDQEEAHSTIHCLITTTTTTTKTSKQVLHKASHLQPLPRIQYESCILLWSVLQHWPRAWSVSPTIPTTQKTNRQDYQSCQFENGTQGARRQIFTDRGNTRPRQSKYSYINSTHPIMTRGRVLIIVIFYS